MPRANYNRWQSSRRSRTPRIVRLAPGLPTPVHPGFVPGARGVSHPHAESTDAALGSLPDTKPGARMVSLRLRLVPPRNGHCFRPAAEVRGTRTPREVVDASDRAERYGLVAGRN